ncbi:LOW QUALITY PROTEIN: uncharacterized protein LOC132794866 [Drosophila nasuta]|uniref:LOW QUALITY PROTEIN: uncharacterized protein LOC132794866 n=1 Tax=Drosophila nasuta TaxID=42062 RepID=UPI00295EB484|nr:LOW QUALITY PROTEIN: uncharacterized protein LOC132794866 [Drosophila nasuta]
MDAESCLMSTSQNKKSKLPYNTDAIFIDKTNGCATDSSSVTDLNVRRLPDNLAITTTTTTGDILTLDLGSATTTTTTAAAVAGTTTTIWAPHGAYENNNDNVYEKQDRLHLSAESGGQYFPHADIYRTHQQQQLHHHQPQRETHPAELLLHIGAKEALGVGVGFGQMIPTLQHHHHHHSNQHHTSSAHHHYEQQQNLNHQLPNNMYAEMMQQQHNQQQHHQQQHSLQLSHQQQPQQHHLHSFNEQPMHYANYSQHYSHEPQVFAMQHAHPNQSHQEQQPQLHPQEDLQQHTVQQLQETYQDMIMDEFHEDRSSAYKLTLSPNIAKPENQDDGYETSAGDVLTPNSHSSSIHSITPQLQMHHTKNHKHVGHGKQDELIGKQTQTQTQNQNQSAQSTSNSPHVATTSGPDEGASIGHSSHHLHTGNANNEAVILSNEAYSFIGEEMTPIPHPVPDTSNDPSYPLNIVSVESGSNLSALGCEAASAAALSAESMESELIKTTSSNIKQLPHQHIVSREPFAEESYEIDTSRQSLDADNSSNSALKLKSVTTELTAPKRRGRKKKLLTSTSVDKNLNVKAAAAPCAGIAMMTGNILANMKPKERKKHDRFNGMSEAEVIKRTIPDHLCDNLDIVIVGINPGLFAAYKGHHYAGPGNHFWKCLYLSGLTQEQMCSDDDHTLLKHGIGFTNMVARATKGSADLTRKEIKEGSRILLEKLQRYRPKVAVFNGKLIFEVFSGKKEFHFGRQPDRVDGTDTYVWVMPSSSARCAQLPRAADKVPFYTALKKFRDFLNGQIQHMDDSECVFTEQRIRQCCEQQDQPLKVNPSTNSQHNFIEQHSNHMFADNIGVDGSNTNNTDGGAECGNIQFNNQLTNVITQDGFIYSNDQGLRNASSSLGAQQQPNYLAILSNHPTPEKRGRPKKIKEPDLGISGNNGSKIPLANQQQDFNNILNLSIIEATGSGGNAHIGIISNSGCINNDSPAKKKRGRPKKLKPTIENMLIAAKSQNTNQLNSEAHIVVGSKAGGGGGMSTIHSLSMEHRTESPQGSHQAPPSLYNTPPPSHMLYTASASPMASPALNCSSYSHSHGTPPVVDNQQSQVNAAVSIRDQQTHLCETPPPSSPNLCTVVDFDPPSERCNGGHDARILPIAATREAVDVIGAHQQSQQEHYQQWLSTNQHHQQSVQKSMQTTSQSSSDVVAHYSQSSTIGSSVSYQPQAQLTPQATGEPDWHHYETNRSYMLPSPHHQHQQEHQNINLSTQLSNNQSHFTTDVTHKSLSGLESLVDQIPAISDHESNTISTATAAAAAAAVESRLLGLQQQQQHHKRRLPVDNEESPAQQMGNDNNSNDSNVISNNFSVSSLAASSATSNEHNHINNHYKIESANLNNLNISSGSSDAYPCHSSTSYPHSHTNHLISAALAAASQQPTTQHPVPSHPHPQMYVDHAHITTMYASPYGPQHTTATSQDYASHVAPYGTMPSAAGQTLHVPSPNYAYAHYGHTTTPQAQYPGFSHSHAHPHAHHHHAHPLPHHGHAPHHLTVLERLKPSDISGYSGF